MENAVNFLIKNFPKVVDIKEDFNEIGAPKKGVIYAIDGGSAILMDGGSWLISKLKIGYVKYDGQKIKEKHIEESHVSFVKKGEQILNSKNISLPKKDMAELPALLLRLLEFNLALQLIDKVEKNTIILMDGLLSLENFENLIKMLKEKSTKKGVSLIGLAKTYRQGISGRSVLGVLLKKGPKTSWYYKLNDTYIVKLHKNAKYVYACDIVGDIKCLNVLKYYSQDLFLPGYPYPLLRVDREVRISSYEKKYEINKLKLYLKKKKLDFEIDEISTNMHSLIDKEKYK